MQPIATELPTKITRFYNPVNAQRNASAAPASNKAQSSVALTLDLGNATANTRSGLPPVPWTIYGLGFKPCIAVVAGSVLNISSSRS